MAPTPLLPGEHALEACGRWPDESSIRSTVSGSLSSWPCLRGIGSNHWAATGAGSTASGSTINIGFAFGGRVEMPTRSRSRTTIESRGVQQDTVRPRELVGRRLPRQRPPTHPGEMLLDEFVRPLGITQSALAIRLGISFPRLNEIIHRKRAVTSDTALRLARVLGMSADFWLGLQLDWDLWHAIHGPKAAEIAQLEPLHAKA